MYNISFIFPLVILALIINYLLPKKYHLVALKSKQYTRGIIVDELTILEWKPLFSFKTFYFHPGEAQETFHTHSFSAYSLLLYGNYTEQFYDPKMEYIWEKPRNRSRLIYIPKDRFHRIIKSKGCRALMLTGPWESTYTEFVFSDTLAGETIVIAHERKLQGY